MKKLLSLLILISVLEPSKVHAVDLIFGATTWWAWWDMKQKRTVEDRTFTDTDINTEPTLLIDYTFTLKFNDDFNLSFLFLFGLPVFERSGYSLPGNIHFTEKGIATRIDSDITLNYRLNYYFKVFAGAKHLGTYITEGERFRSYGPELGLGFTFPILDNLFFLANLSGFYLWGNEKQPDAGGNTKINDYGINSTLSLAYYIAPASTTISLGGKYQYIKTDYNDDSEGEYRKCTFYGVTLSVTYTFNI